VDFAALDASLPEYRLILNTVPAAVLPAARLLRLRQDALVIDLASAPGGAGDGDRKAVCRMQEKRWISLWIAGIALTLGLAFSAWIATDPDDSLHTARQITEQSVLAEQDTAQEPAATNLTAQTGTAPAGTDAAAETIRNTTTTTPDRNLNTADAAALKRVSGVGDVLAEAILAYRAAHGGFTRRQQLTEISGIGEVLAARIMEEFEIPGELPPETTAEVTVTATAEAVTTTAAPVSVPEEPETETTTAEPVVTRYDLNAVTREELCSIPGMTEEYADGILSFREHVGHFSTVYELAAVQSMSGTYIQHVLFEYLYVTDDTVLGKEPETEIYDIRDAAAG